MSGKAFRRKLGWSLFAGLLVALPIGNACAQARAAGQPFTVQVTVLPSGQIVAPASTTPTARGANTPLTTMQKQNLRSKTSAPSVRVTWE